MRGEHVPGERVKLTCLHGLAQALRLLALAPSVSAALLVLTHSSEVGAPTAAPGADGADRAGAQHTHASSKTLQPARRRTG